MIAAAETPAPSPNAKCFDVLHKITDSELSHDQIAKGMTKGMYDLLKDYDVATGKPKGTKTYDDVAGVTALLWKGDVPTTDFVAFGINSGCALARFCVEINKLELTGTAPNQVRDTAKAEIAYKANVEK
jgi:hypothetical protein